MKLSFLYAQAQKIFTHLLTQVQNQPFITFLFLLPPFIIHSSPKDRTTTESSGIINGTTSHPGSTSSLFRKVRAEIDNSVM